ncbi:MAG TPA: hypothetical protein GX717_06260, partial [Clostridiaceae bacterium]|nr:hypothetical protein [Clostridiaceae bacterium]
AATRLQFKLETGRTHQIRLHSLAVGNPLIGETLYGLNKLRTQDRSRHLTLATALTPYMNRQALHATRLGLHHPITGEYLEFESPPPMDFTETETALDALCQDVKLYLS